MGGVIQALGATLKKSKHMKVGFRQPSLKKRISARTSVPRIVRHSLGIKAPKRYGWITNPKKAAYNKVYNKTTKGCLVLAMIFVGISLSLFFCIYTFKII